VEERRRGGEEEVGGDGLHEPSSPLPLAPEDVVKPSKETRVSGRPRNAGGACLEEKAPSLMEERGTAAAAAEAAMAAAVAAAEDAKVSTSVASSAADASPRASATALAAAMVP